MTCVPFAGYAVNNAVLSFTPKIDGTLIPPGKSLRLAKADGDLLQFVSAIIRGQHNST